MSIPSTRIDQLPNLNKEKTSNVSHNSQKDELGIFEKIDGGIGQTLDVTRDGMSANSLNEQQESLFIIAIPPIIWILHFSTSYLTNAIYCSKFSDNTSDSRFVNIAIFGYTALAIISLIIIGKRFHRRYQYQNINPPHNDATRADRLRFLGQAGFLLSILSGVAVTYTSLVAIFVGGCY